MHELKEIITSQKKFQSFMGHNFQEMTLSEKASYIRENILWATDELHEMLHELPFAKTWSSKYETWSEEKISDQLKLTKEEYIDALHFVINIAVALDMSESEIINMYREKNLINYKRQEENY